MEEFKFLDHIPIPIGLKMVIVIPCYNESDLAGLLDDLYNCIIPEETVVEVYFVFNAGAGEKIIHETNRQSFKMVHNYVSTRQKFGLNIHTVLYNQLPDKRAGVGQARKIGMDEASRRLKLGGCKNGLIVNLDADCSVSNNYISAILDWGDQYPDYSGCSIHFEHPIPSEPGLADGIIHYELHLRYYVEAQKFVGLPYAFQTVGSAMCVRASVYEKIGGMNVRKAGEDFYFIHKIIKYGKYGNLNSTTVFPSARVSERVPFGTGRAMGEHLIDRRYAFTYPMACFEVLKEVLESVIQRLLEPSLIPHEMVTSRYKVWNVFLNDQNFHLKWEEIYANCRTGESRIKRFYHWFDAFRLMKFCHHYRDFTGEMEELPTPAIRLAILLGWEIPSIPNTSNILQLYRKAALSDG